MSALRLGVNALFYLPGEVGGSETYLRETLRALSRHNIFGAGQDLKRQSLTPRPANCRSAASCRANCRSR